MLKSLTPERETKFKQVIANRQLDLTVVLENVHDPHNIGAVMRSCDAVGISEIYVIYTEDGSNMLKQYTGLNSSSGARKWVEVHFFTDIEECFNKVKSKYKNIFGTHLGKKSVSLYELSLGESMALVFGNERDGLTEKALSFLDGNFIIPQFGMVQSLNISVACAVSVFEALRQRNDKELYNLEYSELNKEHSSLYDRYLDQHYNNK